MALNDTLATLISDPKWNAYVELLEKEISDSERKALASITESEPDRNSALRAKFLREALELPKNSVNASKMNSNKTPIKK